MFAIDAVMHSASAAHFDHAAACNTIAVTIAIAAGARALKGRCGERRIYSHWAGAG